VRVGKGASVADFVIHEKMIRRSSEFSNKALSGSWREAQDQVVHLPEYWATDFDIYHRWLLEGRLYSQTPDPSGPMVALMSELLVLQPLSDLGHFLQDTDFLDTISDAILQCAKELKAMYGCIPINYGSDFFKFTPESSRIRVLVADLVVWTETKDVFKDLKQEDNHPDFVMALLNAMASKFQSDGSAMSPLDSRKSNASTTAMGSRSSATGQL